ncbi:hypothetical protein ACFWYW_59365, partial [Nonomuraea sp. NPDC059023]|uniref:hypothetical protein n=1 Tax=Nonomuraea sp. NPDC059023 TaxID=3346706 RepID=UPI0036970904
LSTTKVASNLPTSPPSPAPKVQAMGDPLFVQAMEAADAQLAAEHEGVDEWYLGHLNDHIYPTCPGLKRSGQPLRRGEGSLYPEAGDVCGLCLKWWRARKAKEAPDVSR